MELMFNQLLTVSVGVLLIPCFKHHLCRFVKLNRTFINFGDSIKTGLNRLNRQW